MEAHGPRGLLQAPPASYLEETNHKMCGFGNTHYGGGVMSWWRVLVLLNSFILGNEFKPSYLSFEKTLVLSPSTPSPSLSHLFLPQILQDYDTNTNLAIELILKPNEIKEWQKHCVDFEEKYNIRHREVCLMIQEHLQFFHYSQDIIDGTGRTGSLFNEIPSYSQVLKLLEFDNNDSFEFEEQEKEEQEEQEEEEEDLLVLRYPKIRRVFRTNSNPMKEIQFLQFEQQTFNSSQRQSYLPSFLRSQQVILIYQSLGCVTGGTLALQLLHKRLLLLGFQSILCTSKQDDQRCLSPTGKEIVITGEWCRGVLESHGEHASNFRGRGIQYHLGFHHYDDLCR